MAYWTVKEIHACSIIYAQSYKDAKSNVTPTLEPPLVQTSVIPWLDSKPTNEIELNDAYVNIYYSTVIPFRVADATSTKKILKLLRPAYNPPSA